MGDDVIVGPGPRCTECGRDYGQHTDGCKNNPIGTRCKHGWRHGDRRCADCAHNRIATLEAFIRGLAGHPSDPFVRTACNAMLATGDNTLPPGDPYALIDTLRAAVHRQCVLLSRALVSNGHVYGCPGIEGADCCGLCREIQDELAASGNRHSVKPAHADGGAP